MMVAQITEKLSQKTAVTRWILSFASGYLGLGMLDKAEKEVAKLPPGDQHRSEALSLAGQISMARGKWEDALKCFAIGRTLYPLIPDFFVQAAFAYEKAERLLESRNMWELVPQPFRHSGLVHFNLARCEEKLGNLQAAKRHMAKAVTVDPRFQAILMKEPVLARMLELPERDN
jgi:tetratricopeptide (TPR) repeat protein